MGCRRLLTITEAARESGITKQAICAAMKRGDLPFTVVHIEARRIREKDLATYISRTGGKPGRPKLSA